MEKKNEIQPVELDLISMMMFGGDNEIIFLENNVSPEDINNPVVKKIFETSINYYREEGEIDIASVVGRLDGDQEALCLLLALGEHEVGRYEGFDLKPLIKQLKLNNLEKLRKEFADGKDFIKVMEVTKALNKLKEERRREMWDQ